MNEEKELELTDDEECEEVVVGEGNEFIMDQRQIAELMAEPSSNPNVVLELEDYDMDDFQKGIDDHSYISGAITAILNTGVSEQFALEYLLNKDTINYNLKASEVNKELNIKLAKIRNQQENERDL